MLIHTPEQLASVALGQGPAENRSKSLVSSGRARTPYLKCSEEILNCYLVRKRERSIQLEPQKRRKPKPRRTTLEASHRIPNAVLILLAELRAPWLCSSRIQSTKMASQWTKMEFHSGLVKGQTVQRVQEENPRTSCKGRLRR